MFKNILNLRLQINAIVQHNLKQNHRINIPISNAIFPKNISTSIDVQEDDNVTQPAPVLVDADRQKKQKILYLEVDVARQEGRRCPDPELIKPDQWDHLLSLKSRSARTKYYLFLWHLEKKRENHVAKKEKKTEALFERLAKEKLENQNNDHILYGINHTTMFLRIYDATINHWNNHKLIRAMQYGQKIVLDCSYDDYMNQRESVNTAKQLMLCFAENRAHDDPYDLHFCNGDFRKTTMKYLEKHVPTMHDIHFPMNVHQECFTEMFPKENLVYLTPHCKNDLLEYNHDDIYIIGGIVDKVNNDPLSLAKAKKLGIRMARLPLDKYLSWSAGSGKSLTLNQMVNVMLDIKHTGDWNHALRHVPRRKLVDYSKNNEGANRYREENKFQTRSKKFNFNINSWGDDLKPSSASNKYTSYKSNNEAKSINLKKGENPFKN